MSDFLELGLDHTQIDSGTTNDYYTPKFIFDALGVEFDLDVCAPFSGVPWIPARKHFNILDDGLVRPWIGRVWMNPPYSKPSPWIDKFITHQNGIALIPASKANWFDLLWQKAEAIISMPPNLEFSRNDGRNLQISTQIFMVAMGSDNVATLKASGLGYVR